MGTHIKHGATRGNQTQVEYSYWQRIKKSGKTDGIDSKWNESFGEFLKDVGFRPSPAHSLERLDDTKGWNKRNVGWMLLTDARKLRAERRLTRMYICPGSDENCRDDCPHKGPHIHHLTCNKITCEHVVKDPIARRFARPTKCIMHSKLKEREEWENRVVRRK